MDRMKRSEGRRECPYISLRFVDIGTDSGEDVKEIRGERKGEGTD